MKNIISFLFFCIFLCKTQAQVIPEGTYIIRSCVDGMHVIDLNTSKTTDGNNIQIWSSNNTNAQKWRVTHCNGAIVIHSVINQNYVIDLDKSVTKDDTNIQIWQSNGTNAQLWIPEYINGAYILHSAIDQNYVIDLSESKIHDGNNIHIWTGNGTNAQRWIFERVDGASDSGYQSVIPTQVDMPCVGCGGSKKCSICNGNGYTVSASSRRLYHECGACNGTGVCQTCRFR